ncbi:MAG TPA: LysR substrate-binding domain-containing protein [Caulobacteraceae bacterium]|nr:LysR substrate-binding domain-containing protein [Caulobacteraceae bacterium]
MDSLIAEGRLVPLLQAWLPPPARFFLYHPSRRRTPPAVRALIDFLLRESGEAPEEADGAGRT